jgi:hypothetical protein
MPVPAPSCSSRPTPNDEALARYSLTAEDIAFARRRRRAHNRLGFAVQLALVRDLGRPLRAGEIVPVAVVETVAEQIGIDPVVFDLMPAATKPGASMSPTLWRISACGPFGKATTGAVSAGAPGRRHRAGEAIVLAVIDDLKSARSSFRFRGWSNGTGPGGQGDGRRQAYRNLIEGLDPALARLDGLIAERAATARCWAGSPMHRKEQLKA